MVMITPGGSAPGTYSTAKRSTDGDVQAAAIASRQAWDAAVRDGRVEKLQGDHETGFVDGVVWALQKAADDVFDTALPAECAEYLRNLVALALDGEW